MASIREVALKAGVGIGTVSRALNGTGYIAEETKKKIMEAVEELDYRPNELAQNLSRNRSGFIGVMVPELEHPFFAYLTKCMEAELYKYGYKCMVCDVDRKRSRQEEFMEMLRRNVMDGIIACVDKLPDADVTAIRRPVVTMDREWGAGIPNIHSDHRRGGELAAQALLSAGCKRVMQFNPDIQLDQSYASRHTMLENILLKHGCEVINIPVGQNRMGYEYDIMMAQKYAPYLTQMDGIFATDIIAASCLKLAHEAKIDVPGRLKIVGYDGLMFTGLLYPSLTTIRQDIPEIARRCVNTIVKMIEGGKNIQKEQIVDVIYQKGGTV